MQYNRTKEMKTTDKTPVFAKDDEIKTTINEPPTMLSYFDCAFACIYSIQAMTWYHHVFLRTIRSKYWHLYHYTDFVLSFRILFGRSLSHQPRRFSVKRARLGFAFGAV